MKNTDIFSEWNERLEAAITTRITRGALIKKLEREIARPRTLLKNSEKGNINKWLLEAKREKALAEDEIKHLYGRIVALLREES